MSRWWRAYDEAVDDPKLQNLKPELFKTWFNICCVTSQNGGKLPPLSSLAFKLRVKPERARAFVEELKAAGLVDDDGKGNLAPHNWSKRQYLSDVSTDRVKRFRERRRNVSPPAVSETGCRRAFCWNSMWRNLQRHEVIESSGEVGDFADRWSLWRASANHRPCAC